MTIKTYSKEVKNLTNYTGYAKNDEWLLELHDRIVKLEEERINDKKLIGVLYDKLEKYENGFKKSTQPLFSDFFKNSSGVDNKPIYSEPEMEVLNAISNEKDEIARKEKNLIIFGLQHKIDTKKDVENLFSKIGADYKKVVKVIRFNKKKEEDPPAPILLQLKEKSDRFTILGHAKKIKDLQTNYANVSINLDLTASQRFLNKKLIATRKDLNDKNTDNSFYYVIKNNSIQKKIKTV